MEQQQVEETFEDYMRNARDEFVMAVKNEERSNYLLTAIDSFLICFDQMRDRLAYPLPASSSIEGQKEEWISVKDRLPPKFKNVLAISKIGKMAITCVDASGKIDEYELEVDQDDYYTHWRPLPAPPTISKEDEKEK